MKPKPIDIILIVLCVLVVILFFAAGETGKVLLAYIAFALAVIGVILMFMFWRCPYCNRYLGRSYGKKYCPHCGRKLD